MDRRNFLRISALGAMSAACSASGLSKVFAQQVAPLPKLKMAKSGILFHVSVLYDIDKGGPIHFDIGHPWIFGGYFTITDWRVAPDFTM